MKSLPRPRQGAAQPEPATPRGSRRFRPSQAEQREITRLCAVTGQLLMQYGAESALVENVSRRLGLALGVDSVEVAIMANAITVTTLSEAHCLTTVRRNIDHGINMHVVIEVQRAMLAVENGEQDLEAFRQRLDAIRPLRYPHWLLSLLIGASCACFGRLAGAEWGSCGVTFVASALAMFVRLKISALHFNPLVTFFAAAFVATSVALQGVPYSIGETPKIAMAASVLLLVPGYPLINSVSDMVKGYVNTGLARGMMSLLLAASACGGILLSMTVWNVWGWL